VAAESERRSPWGEPAPASEADEPAETPSVVASGQPIPGAEDRSGFVAGNGSGPPVTGNGSGSGAGPQQAPSWPLGPAHKASPTRREHRLLRGIRSGVALAVMALALGVAVAASLGVIVWLIATAIHHAANN
jgi:hypothetical protein